MSSWTAHILCKVTGQKVDIALTLLCNPSFALCGKIRPFPRLPLDFSATGRQASTIQLMRFVIWAEGSEKGQLLSDPGENLPPLHPMPRLFLFRDRFLDHASASRTISFHIQQSSVQSAPSICGNQLIRGNPDAFSCIRSARS